MREVQEKFKRLIADLPPERQTALVQFFTDSLESEVSELINDLYLPSIVSDKRVNAGLLHPDFIKGSGEQAYRLDVIKERHLALYLAELHEK